ncbi:hypothetical protein XO10_06490 [Marinitoga sp. 1135]|uniref:Uncharacterized protein n=1 Tax=Marinitoga piezophila (strain DSM 14283 / JCM 11233 / KA3) TaxID=443254 RepID=H2J3A4_MARPK|nr:MULTISPECIES: NusG domain II-containing protein [Marinitoga]AEX85720.1 hypothetical protein Marpi_1317 [Marinitoga piezophila KA3]APT76172.1 hypothetical protein LN42_07070 [Marinitoga sp. 1137]NUU95928.1 hypothetical protein [Marinitoga sp. 1135]NUU97839.1 hypothetical protein [Marinitoga sp. 1138]
MKKDIIFVGIIILISIITIFLQNTLKNTLKGAKVYISGKEVMEITRPGTYTIKDDKGVYKMKVIFDGSKIKAIDSTCALKICEHTGWVDNASQEIICIPNKIVIKPIGKEKNTGVDVISW